MREEPTPRLSGDQVLTLKFAARRQLARWSSKPKLSPHQHAQPSPLKGAVRILQDQAFASGCELRGPRPGRERQRLTVGARQIPRGGLHQHLPRRGGSRRGGSHRGTHRGISLGRTSPGEPGRGGSQLDVPPWGGFHHDVPSRADLTGADHRGDFHGAILRDARGVDLADTRGKPAYGQ